MEKGSEIFKKGLSLSFSPGYTTHSIKREKEGKKKREEEKKRCLEQEREEGFTRLRHETSVECPHLSLTETSASSFLL